MSFSLLNRFKQVRVTGLDCKNTRNAKICSLSSILLALLWVLNKSIVWVSSGISIIALMKIPLIALMKIGFRDIGADKRFIVFTQ